MLTSLFQTRLLKTVSKISRTVRLDLKGRLEEESVKHGLAGAHTRHFQARRNPESMVFPALYAEPPAPVVPRTFLVSGVFSPATT